MTLAVNIAQIGSNNTTFRNRIINGGMVLDQRNAGSSVSVSTSGVYVLDRWKNRANGGGVFSVQQSSTAPAGFNTAVAYTVTTADSSIAAGDNYWIIQDIEGFNVADLGWGTANAQTVTVSFWVRASVTGTYNVALSNGIAYDRSFVSTYTVNAANTYEYKTITITGDTSGTWLKTNGGGISLVFNLGAGTSFQATANTWSAGFLQSTSGSTNLIATNGATFYITGVQLEAGSTASPFEYRSYGTELMLCQRYYEKSYQPTTVPGTATYDGAQTVPPSTSTRQQGAWYRVTKRVNGTITVYASATGNSGNITVNSVNRAATVPDAGICEFRLSVTGGVAISEDSAFQWTVDSEL